MVRTYLMRFLTCLLVLGGFSYNVSASEKSVADECASKFLGEPTVSTAKEVGIYDDGELYDFVNSFVKEDIPFYSDVVRENGGDVLELACGSGRITLNLLEHAKSVTGLDSSAQMLQSAKEKSSALKGNLQWVLGDMRSFSLGRKFDLILIPYNAFQHLLTLSDVQQALESVRDHLKPGGKLVFDIFNPSLEILTRDPNRRYPIYSKVRNGRGEKIVIEESNRFDQATQINHIQWFYEVEGQRDAMISNIQMRIFFPQEINALLELNGFRIESKYGDYDRSAFAATKMKQVFICSPSK